MRRLSLTVGITAMLSAVSAVAQDTVRTAPDSVPEPFRSGVYLTAADFTARRLAHEIDCRVATHMIDRHTFLNRPYVDVTHRDERMRHAKAEIFGYRGCDSTDVRFAEGREYRVLATAPMLLYERRWRRPGRTAIMFVERRFSTSADAPLRPLTRDEIKRAYPDNPMLHRLLDEEVRSDEELMAFDAAHGTYRITQLLVRATS